MIFSGILQLKHYGETGPLKLQEQVLRQRGQSKGLPSLLKYREAEKKDLKSNGL